jgi:hypothetical protein
VSLCLAGNYDGVPLTFFANITTSVLMNESCRKKPMITDNPALWLLAVTDPGMQDAIQNIFDLLMHHHLWRFTDHFLIAGKYISSEFIPSVEYGAPAERTGCLAKSGSRRSQWQS